MSGTEPLMLSPAGRAAVAASRLVPLAAFLLLSACGTTPPTTQEIREAYADHVRSDRVHEVGLRAKQAPVMIPQQEPRCSHDGSTHYDCRIRVIFETAGGPRSEEQSVHIRHEGGAWIIDSVN